MWPIVKELCDNACWRIVLVCCRVTGRILAYCPMCGAAWCSPAELQINDFVIGFEICPGGIEVPSAEDVPLSPWATMVLEYLEEGEYATASEINEDMARERRVLSERRH